MSARNGAEPVAQPGCARTCPCAVAARTTTRGRDHWNCLRGGRLRR